MPEYIEREALRKAIKGLCWVNKSCEYDALKVIKESPTADVVEVVRCKDCKWWHLQERCSYLAEYPDEPYMEADDFCSCGERRSAN